MGDIEVKPAAAKTHSWRQLVAIERPEERDRETFCTADPHKRKVAIYQHGKTKLQLVSAIQINMDDWPEWDAWVGFMEANGEWSDHFVERRTWTSDMEQAAHRVMRELIAMPYEVGRLASTWRTRGRPSEWHVLFKVTSIERDWITGVQLGTIPKSVRLRDPQVEL